MRTRPACRSRTRSTASRPAPTRLPAPPRGTGLVRDDEREVAHLRHRDGSRVLRVPAITRLSTPSTPGRARSALGSHGGAIVDDAPRRPGLLHTGAHGRRRNLRGGRARVVGNRAHRERRSEPPTARAPGIRRYSSHQTWVSGSGKAGGTNGTRSPASTSSAVARPTARATDNRSNSSGISEGTRATQFIESTSWSVTTFEPLTVALARRSSPTGRILSSWRPSGQWSC